MRAPETVRHPRQRPSTTGVTNPDVSLVDYARTTCLCDAGNPDYLAALVVEADGTERVVLAEKASIGDPKARYNATCHRPPPRADRAAAIRVQAPGVRRPAVWRTDHLGPAVPPQGRGARPPVRAAPPLRILRRPPYGHPLGCPQVSPPADADDAEPAR